jgi:alpha-N-arabinofuranosidase
MQEQLRIMKYLISAVCFLVVGAGTSLGQDSKSSAGTSLNESVVYVDVDSNLGRANRNVLGNNALAYLQSNPLYSAQGAGIWEPKSNRSVPEMIRLARDAGVSTLRWPGGCGVHEYNWKLTVGPLASRPKQAFGLPEFMQVSKDIGAEPVVTLADFWGEAVDAADLVEYLNAPVGKNPNAGKDWAAVRVADGHPEPYGVIWFEFGNETFHGPHSGSSWNATKAARYSPEQYARRYQEFRAAMRAVDPGIKLGAVLANDSKTMLSRWTEVVIKKTGNIADFFIHHAYLPYYDAEDGKPDSAEIYRGAFSSAVQFDSVYEKLNQYIRAETGRQVPLAITEFNGHFVQNKPVPYRLSLGTAVQVADLIQVLLTPKHNIAMAQYWLFANEYWGMVKGYESPYTLRPAYHVFKLYQDHLGDSLIATTVQGEGFEQDGGFDVMPAKGVGSRFDLYGSPQVVPPDWRFRWVYGATAEVDGSGMLSVSIKTDSDLDYYHSRISLPAKASTGYRVTAEVRAEGLTRMGAELQVGDARGWGTTKSAALSSDMVLSPDWTPVKADYVTLPDTKNIEILARRRGGSQESGRFWIRNLSIQPFTPFVLPKVPFVGAIATKRGKQVSVFVVNRRIDGQSPVRIVVPKFSHVRAWVLSGPSVDATNEVTPNNVAVSNLPVSVQAGQIQAKLPPHSFAVFDFSH